MIEFYRSASQSSAAWLMYAAPGTQASWGGNAVTPEVIIALCTALALLVMAGSLLLAMEWREPLLRRSLASGAMLVMVCGLAYSTDHMVSFTPRPLLRGEVGLLLAAALLGSAACLPLLLSRLRALHRKAATSARNENLFLGVTQASLDSIYVMESVRDPAGAITDFRFSFVNEGGGRLIRLQPTEVVGQLLCELLPVSRTAGFFERYKRVAETGESQVFEFPIDDESVQAKWLKCQAIRMEDGVVVVVSDLSEKKRLEVERSKEFTQSLIDKVPAAIVVTDANYVITAVNAATEKMLWYTSAELVGRENPRIFFDPEEIEAYARQLSQDFGTRVFSNEAPFYTSLKKGVEHQEEWTFHRKGGSSISVEATVTPLVVDLLGETGFMIMAYDISERKRREEYISHISQHDALTGLPTRHLLYDRLEMMLARGHREDSACAVVMLDLNHFKEINDFHGHQTGDHLLIQVASSLKASLRATDTVARLGGDEFVLLLSDLKGPEDAEALTSRIKQALSRPMMLGNKLQVTASASMGISMYPHDADDGQSLLRMADTAMYYAKSQGGTQIEFYSQDLAQRASQRQEIEAGLREALQEGGFEVDYQPIIDLNSGAMQGLEALLRWRSARLGSIAPADFIPIAEETGLIHPIGEWVIRRACKDVQALNKRLGRQLFVSVNVSPCELEQRDLLSIVEGALTDAGLGAGCLEVELTERVLMADSERSRSTLEGLRKLGIRLAIDDFGSGFSNMAYLLRMSVDRIKLDREIIRDCASSAQGAALSSAMVNLGRKLNISVIAEGIETAEQMEFLVEAGCQLGQGYYFSRPARIEVVGTEWADSAELKLA